MSNADTMTRFEETSFAVVESVRLGDGLKQEIFAECEQLLEALIGQLKCKDQVPKRLMYAIQVLRDNLIGALSVYRGTEREHIVRASSYLDGAIDRLLLG